jgi:hypothetical protein
LHGSALGALLVGPRAGPKLDQEPAIEVTLDQPPPPEEAPRPEPPLEPAAPGEVSPPTATLVARNNAPSRRVEEPVLMTEAPPGPSASASEGWAMPVTVPHGINLGLDGGIAWRPSLNPAGDEGGGDLTPAQRRDVGGLRSGLAERDRDLGFGSGGRIASAVRDADRAIAELRDGAATIQFVTDAAGNVVSVRVVDVTSNERGWTEAAEAIRSALKQRPLTVPSGARGKVVTVRVEVAMRLPSGSQGGVRGLANGDGVGGAADLSDIGARPRAVAKSRVLSEEAL